jgi:plastocyanin
VIRTNRFAALALAAVAGLGLAACGDDSDDSTDSTEASATDQASDSTTESSEPEGDAAVTVKTFQFDIPESVPAGTVTITNEDDTTHTFTADDRSFDVSLEGPGSSGTIDVEAGSYPVHCDIHPSMTGTLVVS